MKRRKRDGDDKNQELELLKDMFIASLLLQGVPQGKVAKVVQVATVRVNRIGKYVKAKGS